MKTCIQLPLARNFYCIFFSCNPVWITSNVKRMIITVGNIRAFIQCSCWCTNSYAIYLGIIRDISYIAIQLNLELPQMLRWHNRIEVKNFIYMIRSRMQKCLQFTCSFVFGVLVRIMGSSWTYFTICVYDLKLHTKQFYFRL